MSWLVLNEYRSGSSYNDIVGKIYHYPNRYHSRMVEGGPEFLYYEPRRGGSQVYFGRGIIGTTWSDTSKTDHSYAEVLEYDAFHIPVSYWRSDKSTRELSTHMRNSVRDITSETAYEILEAAGITKGQAQTASADFLAEEYLHATPERKRALASRYERPSRLTEHVKKTRGPTCQLCGYPGFQMISGRTYCEVHHIHHVCEMLPGSLHPDQLIVVCANCHRRLHFARVADPKRIDDGWVLKIDDETFRVSMATAPRGVSR